MSERVLPEGWVLASIDQVSFNAEQRKPDAAEQFIYVDIGSIDRENKVIASPQRLAGSDAPSRARKVIRAGDVLVSLTRPNLNAVALVGKEYDGQIASTGFEVIRPVGIDSRLLFSLVRSASFIDAISGKVQGALYPAAKSSDVKAFQFRLPPLEEQKAIADKVDVLLAQVSNIKARLDAIPAILTKFRQSVLAAAVNGKFSENWRGGDSSYVGGFPEGWGQEKFSSLGELARGKSKHRPRNDSRLFGDKYPFIQTGEVANANGVISSAEKYYNDFGLSQSRLFPKGTLCITIAANIADTALLGIDACFPDSVVGFIANDATCDVRFVKYFIDVNKVVLEEFAPATAQKNINLKVLNSLVFPMPSVQEQKEIVGRVDQLFAFADQIEQQVKNAQARVNKLTQSILAKAFRGELTAEWRAANPELISGENSAEALLERIKVEGAKQKPAGKKPGRKAAAETAAS